VNAFKTLILARGTAVVRVCCDSVSVIQRVRVVLRRAGAEAQIRRRV